jgi:hypothetical protein
VIDVHAIQDWHSPAPIRGVYERLLAALGTEEFGTVVRDSLALITHGVHRLYLFELGDEVCGDLQYYTGEPGLSELIPIYRKLYMAQDPINGACSTARNVSDMAILRLKPADIRASGFRRRFYEEAGVIERLSVVQRGSDSWRVINLARHHSDGLFSNVEISAIVSLSCILLPMLPLCRTPQTTPRRLTLPQVEDRFSRRFLTLTPRERQVCARACVGMSVEATALDLSIGKTSVLTYRQRSYRKLGVTSPIELNSLVSH